MRMKRVIFYFIFCLAIVSCQSVNKAPKYKSAITKPTILATEEQNKKTPTNTARANHSSSKDAALVFPPSQPIEENTVINSKPKEFKQGHLTLELQEVRIDQALKIILGDLLKQSYVLPPNLKGRVTLKTASPLRQDQMYAMLQSVLKLNDLSLRKNNEVLEIIPIPLINGGVTQFGQDKSAAGYGIEAIPLRHISAKKMAKLLTPLISKTMSIPPSNANDVILITGIAEDRKKVRKAINLLDIDQMSKQHIGLFKLKNATPEEVILELNRIFQPNGGSIVSFTSIDRLNAILAIAPTENYIKSCLLYTSPSPRD